MGCIEPAVTYQGGKHRLAQTIADAICQRGDILLNDLCCGSGAVSIELVNRGVDPSRITMLDRSPWGLFWSMVGNCTFDINRLENVVREIPTDRSLMKAHAQSLFSAPVGDDCVYVFLVLQASTFGGAAVWSDNNQWKKSGGFRSYWMPTATSNRRSPVNPMMPLPGTLVSRVRRICEKMNGVCGIHSDIRDFIPADGSTTYIDPPYDGTAFYGFSFDVKSYLSGIRSKCYVSEGKPLSERATMLSGGRKKGGMSGNRDAANQEWLSEIN